MGTRYQGSPLAMPFAGSGLDLGIRTDNALFFSWVLRHAGYFARRTYAGLNMGYPISK